MSFSPPSPVAPVAAPWSGPHHSVHTALGLASAEEGLSSDDAVAIRARTGPNTLPTEPRKTTLQIAWGQFKSPLILILVVAAVVSVALGDRSDAVFIAIVLVTNALIGTLQERGAARSAEALRSLLKDHARVVRGGHVVDVDGAELVPGDVVLLEPGDKVPADLRLLHTTGVCIDESLLTGESVAVAKDAHADVASDAALSDRVTMAHAGTLVTRGYGRGVVVAIAKGTALGGIATLATTGEKTAPPLLVRLDRFTKKIAVVVVVAAVVLGIIGFLRGEGLHAVFLTVVALAVSAIPEGLPIALTVALSLSARRMAKKNVLVRRLVSVEALGSCTFIASDKTGTLTKNELRTGTIAFVDSAPISVDDDAAPRDPRWLRLATAVTLNNEATLNASGLSGRGDAVDVAMLVWAHRAGIDPDVVRTQWPRRCALPFEAERQWAASVHDQPSAVDPETVHDERPAAAAPMAWVKGAPERIVSMCATAAFQDGDHAFDEASARAVAHRLAELGGRVLAVAAGPIELASTSTGALDPACLRGLTLLGFIGLNDPLRPEAAAAIAACRQAGIEVAIVTGDHPATALAIARSLGIAAADASLDDVVTGPMLRASEVGLTDRVDESAASSAAEATSRVDALVRGRSVFARIEPDQKLAIVHSLRRQGHFVAVTGDGANDAPALRAAHIGVAMGARGTDVAKETADLILTDDNFASIVAGVEEGRVAYDTIRKIVFLAISTGAAELLLFALAVVWGTPLPLLPVQLLWMNLVTNGIQDVGLAFEPRERDVMRDRPRRPDEPIVDRIMTTRVVISAAIMSVVSFVWFKVLLDRGVAVEMARNQVLLLMVLFENVHAGNCRSEHRSLLTHSPLKNPILFIGTVSVQALHLVAMHVPFLAGPLGLSPVSLDDWLTCVVLSLTLLVAMELEKAWRRQR